MQNTIEHITIERLDNFGEIMKEYNKLLEYKQNLTNKINSLSGIDYSKDKIQSGNGKKTSQQEHYVISLEKINNRIREYEAWLTPEKEIIKNQISRVPKRDYRKLLILRYIEKWKWAEIVQEFFEFERDYEAQKKLKYWDTVMYWNRAALNILDYVSSRPYIPEAKQLTIQEFHY